MASTRPKRNACQIVHKTADEITIAKTKANTKRVYQPTAETLSSFAERTTLHGIRSVFTGSIFKKYVWALTLMNFGYCSYEVLSSVAAFIVDHSKQE